MLGLVNLLNTSIDVGASVTDSGINAAIDKVTGIVQTLLIVIYVVLGLFLVIKGALIGMQIVKAADEPQVRQEKIGSLKWLVIGVAIAYAATFVVNIVVGFFKDAFN